jgi:beta-ketodecanoyl-[acyl-carrier-protein] synthase
MTNEVFITGTGTWVPPNVISNEELVNAYNVYAATDPEHVKPSSAEFILKASGIRQRHVIDKEGILDPNRLHPRILDRPNEEPSIQCEMSVHAAREAMSQARVTAEAIDTVFAACSNFQRPYPAVSIEVQDQLGIQGYAMDLNVGCGSALFAMRQAYQAIACGDSKGALIVVPELVTGHVNFRDRDSHFIFSDASCAIVLQAGSAIKNEPIERFRVLSTRAQTVFSNNIRNNFGFLSRCDEANKDKPDKLFVQKGREVFKEVVPMVVRHIQDHLGEQSVKRYWLHQANHHMNKLIIKMLVGPEATPEQAPNILDEYANTAAAGSIFAFHRHRADFVPGERGIICSFGAGYSIGSVLVEKV